MLSIISKNIAIITLAFFVISSPLQAGEKGEYFQKWDKEAQTGFVSTTISMALTIASQTDKAMANCIFEWYGKGDAAIENKREAEVSSVISENVSYSPYAVVLAVIQKECGKFPAR